MQPYNEAEISSLNPPFKAIAGREIPLHARGSIHCAAKHYRDRINPGPTVKVFFNIGSDRIDTLHIFVTNRTFETTVETGSSLITCATGKV